jgi:hypothetical protein
MRILARLLSALALASLIGAQANAQSLGVQTPGAPYVSPYFGVYVPAAIGPVSGDPTALTITSALWTSSTDLAPASQFINGWTADLTIKGATPAGATSAYAPCVSGGVATGVCGSIGSPTLSFVDTYPGYDSSGNATTGTTTIYATGWLRQTYNNSTLPTETANGGDAKIALTLSDFVFPADTLGTASAASGLYVSNLTSNAKTGIPVTNASTRTYPRGAGQWITAPGERIGSGQGFTVEFFGGQQYGQNLKPFAAVKITACDSAAHCVTKTISSMSMSAKQLSFSCTGTNGSATLTSCGSTLGVIDGERFTVPGIPGQPRLLSHTSTSLTFGSNQQCQTSGTGDITVNTVGSLAGGDALADGGFAGATITAASNITSGGGTATITSETLSADVTMASTKATAAKIHTGATTNTSGPNACTINHVFQGTTGSVTATVGVPVPVWSATFSAADFTGASFVDGVISFRAQGYPVRGNVVLDSQTGADGSGCDWFYINGTGTGGAGVCDSGNAAWFNINGTDVSANLHNLWAYLDTAGTYAPKYAWVGASAGASPAVQSTGADPGSTAYYGSIKTAADALKTAYGGAGANGGVVCLIAAGSPYSTFGGTLASETLAAKPRLTIASATTGGTCSPAYTSNADQTVALKADATIGNRVPASLLKLANLTINGDANTIQGSEGAQATAFNTASLILDNIKGNATAATVWNKIGVWSIYNSFVDQSAFDGRYLQPASSTTGALRIALGSTLICGSFTTHKAKLIPYTMLGNIGWDCEPDWSTTTLDNTGQSTFTQPVGSVLAYNKFMGMNAAKAVWAGTQNNFLLANNIFELINSTVSPALQVSGDSANTPVANLMRSYNTVLGGRTNLQYLEGVPPPAVAIASGGTFAAGTYYVLTSYALKSNPTVETSTDGINGTSGVFSGVTVALNGSITVDLPCNPNYVATIYVGLSSDITGTGSSATLGHYATVGGVDAKQLAMCQTVTLTAQGSAHTSPSVASSTGGNMLKTNFFELGNIDNNYNMKGDLFGGTVGQAGSYASGGKVGNWEGRFRVGKIGNVFVTGSVVGSGYNPSSGQGEFPGLKETSNSANSQSDISWVTYASDRSIGAQGSTATTVLSPALNLGQGYYRLKCATSHGKSQIPAGLAQWPTDVDGGARDNTGAGSAGAYEGCV